MPPKTPPGMRYAPRQDSEKPFWNTESQKAPVAPPTPTGRVPGASHGEPPVTDDPAVLARWFLAASYEALVLASTAMADGDWEAAGRHLETAASHASQASLYAPRAGRST